MYGHVSGGSLSSCLFTFVVLHLKDRAVFFTEFFFFIQDFYYRLNSSDFTLKKNEIRIHNSQLLFVELIEVRS